VSCKDSHGWKWLVRKLGLAHPRELAGIDRSTPELNRAFLRAAVFADRAFLERIVEAV
jgi:hypothetical protein